MVRWLAGGAVVVVVGWVGERVGRERRRKGGGGDDDERVETWREVR